MAYDPTEFKVFISSRESTCDSCKSELGKHAWIFLAGKRGALCLSCADLDHLVFLPAGDATLTRRARKYSMLYVIVLKWSRARKRYERQGLLLEEGAIGQAEAECLSDEDVRARKKERSAEKRAELDQAYVKEFTRKINSQFPGCNQSRAKRIAEHACRKYSNRVGRSAAAKAFEEDAILLAVAAHIRHTETNYDELLMRGRERYDARREVGSVVQEVLEKWAGC